MFGLQSWERESFPTSKYSFEYYFVIQIPPITQGTTMLHQNSSSPLRLRTTSASLVGQGHVRGRINSGQTNHSEAQHLTSLHSQRTMRIKFRPRCNQLLKNKIVKEGPRWASPTLLHQLPEFSLHDHALQHHPLMGIVFTISAAVGHHKTILPTRSCNSMIDGYRLSNTFPQPPNLPLAIPKSNRNVAGGH